MLKYPRTYHLPSSPGLASDDKRLPSTRVFEGRRVIVTEKMDGEGTSMTREATWPRSPDGRSHPSRNWIKAHHARKAFDIPDGWRISGEYMYARHSLPYTQERGNALPSFFLGFGVWDDSNRLMGWDRTVEVLQDLGFAMVPVLYDGPYSDRVIAEIAASIDPERQEGFVVRDADEMDYPGGGGDGRFFEALAKWVRPRHHQTGAGWASAWRDEAQFRNELQAGLPTAP